MSRYCQGPGLQQPWCRPEPVQGLWLIGPLSDLHSWSLLCWLVSEGVPTRSKLLY